MLVPPERVDYFNKTLGLQLQRLVISLRSYQELQAVKTEELPIEARRMWELGQRYRLVKDRDEEATHALLSACKDAYHSLYDDVLNLVDALDNVSIQVLELEKEMLQLIKEQETSSSIPVCFKELLDLIEEFLKCWLSQIKFLELSLRQLHPKYELGESALEAFKADLQLPEHVEAFLALGLAKIERYQKNPLDFLNGELKTE